MLLNEVRQRLGLCKLRGCDLLEEADRSGVGCRIKNPALGAGRGEKIGLLDFVGGWPLVRRILFRLRIEFSLRNALGVFFIAAARDGEEDALLTQVARDDRVIT